MSEESAEAEFFIERLQIRYAGEVERTGRVDQRTLDKLASQPLPAEIGVDGQRGEFVSPVSVRFDLGAGNQPTVRVRGDEEALPVEVHGINPHEADEGFDIVGVAFDGRSKNDLRQASSRR